MKNEIAITTKNKDNKMTIINQSKQWKIKNKFLTKKLFKLNLLVRLITAAAEFAVTE